MNGVLRVRQAAHEISPHLEAQLVSELSALLAGSTVGAELVVEPGAEICDSLELVVPLLLRRRYPEWAGESLDGVFVALGVRTGPAAVRLAGTCVLMSDQTVTPLSVDLALSPSGLSLDAFSIRLGEAGGGPLGISGPPCNSHRAARLLASLPTRLPDVAWSYRVEGGGAPPLQDGGDRAADSRA